MTCFRKFIHKVLSPKKKENKLQELEKIVSNAIETINPIKNDINILKDDSRHLREDISTLKNEMMAINNNISNLNNALTEINTNVNFNIKRTNDAIFHLPRKILYNIDFERKMLRDFYTIDFSSTDFINKFITLTKNLDSESINSVITIIKKWQSSKDTMGKTIDIYTPSEQQKIQELSNKFFAKILKLSDDLYAYKQYLVPFKEINSNVFYFRHGLELVENIDSLKNKDIMDIGGFIGESVLIFSPLTQKKVHSFEPVKSNFELMQKTIELNNIKNVVTQNYALGASEGQIEIKIADSCSCIREILGKETERTEVVNMITLDNYVNEHNIEVGMIKVDVEGYEQEFLKGAENTIRTQKPILLLSIYHNPDDFFGIKPMIEKWDLGYKFKIFKAPDSLISLETLLIAEVN